MPAITAASANTTSATHATAVAAAATAVAVCQVVSGFDLLAGADCMVETPPGLGLAVLSAPEPLHYYSLFSHTIGYDVVVRFTLLLVSTSAVACLLLFLARGHSLVLFAAFCCDWCA